MTKLTAKAAYDKAIAKSRKECKKAMAEEEDILAWKVPLEAYCKTVLPAREERNKAVKTVREEYRKAKEAQEKS